MQKEREPSILSGSDHVSAWVIAIIVLGLLLLISFAAEPDLKRAPIARASNFSTTLSCRSSMASTRRRCTAAPARVRASVSTIRLCS